MTKEDEKPDLDSAEDEQKLLAAGSDGTDGSAPDSGGSGSARDEDEDEEDDDDDDDDDDDEESETRAESPAKPAVSAKSEHAAPARAVAAPAGHAHAVALDDHGHGLAHVMPIGLLASVLGVLLFLTVVTVLTAGVDLGAQWNLVVALVIATIKAGLVVTYFMHLRWDKKLHLLVFLSSVLFLILFLSMALTDRKEYQRSIDQVDEKASAQ